MAKLRAASISRFVRSCRLRKSATERRYLSYKVGTELSVTAWAIRIKSVGNIAVQDYSRNARVTYFEINNFPIFGFKLFLYWIFCFGSFGFL